MKILHISDTHQYTPLVFKQLNELAKSHKNWFSQFSFIVCSGDIMSNGFYPMELDEFISFAKWCKKNDIHLVFVPGNHDRPFDEDHWDHVRQHTNPYTDKKLTDRVAEIQSLTYYTDNGIISLPNGVKVYGYAYQQPFYNWAFNRMDEVREMLLNNIEDCDVVVSHAPPYGILDQNMYYEHCGDVELSKALERINTKAVLFGHIHEDGLKRYDKDGILYVNGSMLDGRYNLMIDVWKSGDELIEELGKLVVEV